MSSPRQRIRPTRDGGVAIVAGLALLLASAVSGNNLVVLVAAPVWAVTLCALPAGWANLRALEVRRQLPAELTAGRDASGRLLLRNGRRRLAARALELVDEGTTARATCGEVAPGEVAALPTRWRFDQRGRATLRAVEVRSTWPLGLFVHEVRAPLAGDLVVYPRPLPAAAPPRSGGPAGVEEQDHGRGTGDFLGIRPWREGDPPRSVHWLSSARTGAWKVVERSGEAEVSVEVVVQAARGPGWERELSRAAGEVNRAFQLGRKVGLRVPGEAGAHLQPQAGAAWRRQLLEVLALQARGGP